MDPLTFYQYQKFVYQEPDVRIVPIHHFEPIKPFEVKSPDKSDKSKKDIKKNKDSPFSPPKKQNRKH